MINRIFRVSPFEDTFFLFWVTSHSSTKSSVRESGKVKVGAADKMSTVAAAARADTKGKGTPDHLGKLLKLHVN